MLYGGALWGGTLWAGGLWGGLVDEVLSPIIVAHGAGGGLDAWDRAFSRDLEKLWDRPRRKDMVSKENQEQDEEAAIILAMLGYTI